MSTNNLIDLRVKNSEIFRDSLYADHSYIVTAKDTPWENDNTPPEPNGSYKEFREFQDEINFTRQILRSETIHLIKRITWSSNVVYDTYRHDYSESNRTYSNNNSLLDSNFYVINSQNIVYVCLDNNSNNSSKIEPRDGDEKPFKTVDGYQWLRLFTVKAADLRNYSTSNFIPVTDSNVYVQPDGAVFTVIINNPGNNYTNSPVGTLSKRPYFYCRIVGDGNGAVARVTVSSGKISRVDIINYGSGYSEARMDFKKGTVFRTLEDLNYNINPLDPEGDGTLDTTVIIQPPGGWGSDLVRQLCARRVGLFCDITSQTDMPDFRQVGILQDVKQDENGYDIKNSGLLTYLSNSSPITRSADEIIKIALIISF